MPVGKLNFSFTHSSFLDVLIRFFKILKRYGLDSKKMESNLKVYLQILRKHGIVPSFFLTATALNKHAELINRFAGNGAEFCVHGYKHIDYTNLPHEVFTRHLVKALDIFKEQKVPFSGFRFPYLKYEKNMIAALGKYSIKWDSSSNILWHVLKDLTFEEKQWMKYHAMLKQYNSKSSDCYISVPRFCGSILEIPVSLPDDDLLERLGIRRAEVVADIWTRILKQTYSRGELFALQLHPERILYCKEALKHLIIKANSSEPGIWVAPLSSIYEWWKEKAQFRIKLKKVGVNEYEFHAHCSERGTVLIKSNDCEPFNLLDGYAIADNNTFKIKSRKRPIIGVSKMSSPNLINFLRNEGLIFEIDSTDNGYSVFLDESEPFNEEDELRILQKIHGINLPLVRFWRWPNGCQSALSITGDIDALSSIDFFQRVFALSSLSLGRFFSVKG